MDSMEWDHDEDSATFRCVNAFKDEEFIDDWLDLTVLEAQKRGPALENRLVGDAEMKKRLLDRASLRAADGVNQGQGVSLEWERRVFRKVLSSETRGPNLHNRGPFRRNSVSLNRTADE